MLCKPTRRIADRTANGAQRCQTRANGDESRVGRPPSQPATAPASRWRAVRRSGSLHRGRLFANSRRTDSIDASDVGGALPQSAHQHRDDVGRNLWLLAHQVEKGGPVQDEQVRVRQGHHVG